MERNKERLAGLYRDLEKANDLVREIGLEYCEDMDYEERANIAKIRGQLFRMQKSLSWTIH